MVKFESGKEVNVFATNMELPDLELGPWNLVNCRSKPKASSGAFYMHNVGNRPINKDLGVKSNA